MIGLGMTMALAGCSPAIEMSAPKELKVRQVGYGPSAAVELSWRVVIRTGGYLVNYGQIKGGPYQGSGLTLVRWALGCGDFDGGAVPIADASPADTSPSDASAPPADAGWPGFSVDSPVRIPADWCLEMTNTFSDAGFQPTSTPAARPKVRLTGLLPGRTYYFTLNSFRLASTSEPSAEVAITLLQSKPDGGT